MTGAAGGEIAEHHYDNWIADDSAACEEQRDNIEHESFEEEQISQDYEVVDPITRNVDNLLADAEGHYDNWVSDVLEACE